MMATSSPPEGNLASSFDRSVWEGSDVIPSKLDWIVNTQRVPPGVHYWLPSGEIVLVPLEGERVVFIAHFEQGFGLPINNFFWDFLEYYGLQPHHMPANAIMTLSAFAAFYEGYAGIEPFVVAWAKYF
jgi:hypothetical protein